MLNLFRNTIFLWLLFIYPQLQANEAALNNGTAPINEWTWVDVEGSKCGNGEQTGFGVSPGTGDDVLFYLEGGGACWDEITCSSLKKTLNVQLASYFTTGYTEEDFWDPNVGIFDRTREDNPFKDATHIYIPYCTGDLHAGSTTQWFPVSKKVGHFNGRKNLELYLEKITSWFPEPSRVTLAGTSAGGFGTSINYWFVKEAFGDTRVDMVTDAAAILWTNSLIFGGYRAWNLAAALPPDCPNCRRNVRNVYTHYSKTYPESRFALTTYDKDIAIAASHVLLPQLFSNEVKKLTTNTLKPLPNFEYFIADGTIHGTLYQLDTKSQAKKCRWSFIFCFPTNAGQPKTLGAWLTDMASDSPQWKSATSILDYNSGRAAAIAKAKAKKAAKAKARAAARAAKRAKARARQAAKRARLKRRLGFR